MTRRTVYGKKDKELAALLEEHGKGRAGDPHWEYFQGELHLLRGEFEKADPHFTAALAKKSPKDEGTFRDGFFRVRVKAGKAVATYQENEPGPRRFAELAAVCVRDKDAKQLQDLIDVHRKDHADDPNIPGEELEVKWLNQDYEGVLNLLKENREEVFSLPRFKWKAQDYRVRCLVKLKRTQDAIREAEAVAKGRFGNNLPTVLAHASGGDVKQTIAVVEKLRPQPYLLRSYYQDDDLGPILRGEPFKEFRDKFPEPKEEEVRRRRFVDDD